MKAAPTATSAASTDTKPPTAASEMRPKASDLVLSRFDFERHSPCPPKASFSPAELFDQLLKDEVIMTMEELDKKYGFYGKIQSPLIPEIYRLILLFLEKSPNKGVPAHTAMEIIMEEIGSI